MLYQQFMAMFAIIFVTLLACRMYVVHRARTRRALIPVRLTERKTIHAARVEKWALLRAEEKLRHERGKRVKSILDPFWNVNIAVREEERKRGKLIPVYPLTNDRGLRHR